MISPLRTLTLIPPGQFLCHIGGHIRRAGDQQWPSFCLLQGEKQKGSRSGLQLRAWHFPSVARSLTLRAEADAMAAGKLLAPRDGPGSVRMTAALAIILILTETRETQL